MYHKIQFQGQEFVCDKELACLWSIELVYTIAKHKIMSTCLTMLISSRSRLRRSFSRFTWASCRLVDMNSECCCCNCSLWKQQHSIKWNLQFKYIYQYLLAHRILYSLKKYSKFLTRNITLYNKRYSCILSFTAPHMSMYAYTLIYFYYKFRNGLYVE